MKHQSGKKKLNRKEPHKRAMLRNQAILFITHGHLVTTKPRAKETQRLVERLVTLARKGNTFNTRRRAKALLPYQDKALVKLFTEIAPKYAERPGGYTRIIPMPNRISDTAPISRLEWV